MYYTYIVANKNGQYYIGNCKDIETRLRRHNQNSVRSTKNKGPFQVLIKEELDSRSEARRRERQIKSFKGGRAFKKLVENPVPPSSSLV